MTSSRCLYYDLPFLTKCLLVNSIHLSLKYFQMTVMYPTLQTLPIPIIIITSHLITDFPEKRKCIYLWTNGTDALRSILEYPNMKVLIDCALL